MSTQTAPGTIDALHVQVRPSIVRRATQSGTRHLVKWKVGRSDKTKSFQSRDEAKAFHADLVAALRHRERFDLASGVPVSMLLVGPGPTVLDLACELVEREWAEWSPGNRMGRVEALASLCAVLVEPRKGRPDAALMRRWARDKELVPEDRRTPVAEAMIGGRRRSVEEQERAADWMIANSLPVAKLSDTLVIEDALRVASVRADGKLCSADTRQRTRSSLSLLCELAVRKKLLVLNPVPQTRRRVDDATDEIDPSKVPTPSQARALVRAACEVSAIARKQYGAYLTLLWSTGMRPSEASGIHLDSDLELPEEGWGRVILRAPTVYPGARWTTETGSRFEDRDRLKARRRGATRTVQLPPETVAAIRLHIEDSQVKQGDRLFTNSRGKPIDPSSMSKVWRKARERAFEDGSFATLTVYELRHCAASNMLRAGVPVPKVAEELGNSPATLMRVYARVLATDATAFTNAMDKLLSE